VSGAVGSVDGAITFPGSVSSSPIAVFSTCGGTLGLRTEAIEGAFGFMIAEGGPDTVGARRVVGAGCGAAGGSGTEGDVATGAGGAATGAGGAAIGGGCGADAAWLIDCGASEATRSSDPAMAAGAAGADVVGTGTKGGEDGVRRPG
jgi:hypothetical protein